MQQLQHRAGRLLLTAAALLPRRPLRPKARAAKMRSEHAPPADHEVLKGHAACMGFLQTLSTSYLHVSCHNKGTL